MGWTAPILFVSGLRAHASAPLYSLLLSPTDLLPLLCVPLGAVATPVRSPVAQGRGPTSQGCHCLTLYALWEGGCHKAGCE